MGDGLTDRQRKLADEWLVNGHNGTAAARKSGCKGNDAVCAAHASRTLKIVKVMAYIEKLTGKAIAKAERDAVASLTECLEFETRVMRSKLGDFLGDDGEASVVKIKSAPEGLIRKLKIKSTTDAEGQVYAQHEIELESAQDAAKTLIKHHTAKAGQIAAGALADAIRTLPAETVVMIARAMLTGPKPIEVTARVIG